MKSIALLLIFSLCLDGVFVWAASETLPDYLPGTCIFNPKDPFEPNMKMNHGPLKGLCVNPLTRRSVTILNSKEAQAYFPARAGNVVVANFSHLNRFWVAEIPVEKVESMLLQIQYFPVWSFPKIEIAHTQFLFQFSPGAEITLLPQTEHPESAESIKLKRMIFSVENIGPYGELFDAMKGMKGHYNLAYRAVSLSDKYKWMVQDFNNLVEQKKILLKPAQVQKVLMESLSRATEWSTGREYHTITKNCVTEQFNILDKVLHISGYPEPFIPNLAAHALWARGLLDTKTKLPTLNEAYDGQP